MAATILAIPLATLSALAQPVPEPRFELSVEGWLSSGRSDWEISFNEMIPETGLLKGTSHLDWKDLDAPVYTLRGQWRATPWLRMAAEFGFGSIDDGKNSDTDWLALPGYEQPLVFAKSVAETTGETSFWAINSYIRINEWTGATLPGRWDVVLGYRFHAEDVRDRNGVLITFFDEPAYSVYEGLDSTYRFEWQALRAGLRGAGTVANRLSIRGEAVALLAVQFDGEGYWNLRDDFRDSDPNFVHEASSGSGYEVSCSLSYAFSPLWHAELGYRWLHLDARDGTDVTYFADGTDGEAKLDRVSTDRHGFTLSLMARF